MKIEKRIKLLLALFVLPILIGCESEKDFINWMEKTEDFKIEALKQSEVVPYRNEQFMALKSYFKEINLLAISLKEDEKRVKKLNSVLKRKDLEEICAKILLENNDWKRIAKNCKKNNFFLCSEEVRAYPEAIDVLRKILADDQKVRFDQAGSCKRAIN